MGVIQATFSMYVLILAYSLLRVLPRNRVPGWVSASTDDSNCTEESVAIVLSLYDEDMLSIKATLDSVIVKDYPKDRIRVYLVIEEGDTRTLEAVNSLMRNYEDRAGLDYTVIISGCRRNGGR